MPSGPRKVRTSSSFGRGAAGAYDDDLDAPIGIAPGIGQVRIDRSKLPVTDHGQSGRAQAVGDEQAHDARCPGSRQFPVGMKNRGADRAIIRVPFDPH